ncbi:MAG: MaoC/PaaZ C-terminal domain-containing protein [Sulfolobales archaeon]
MPSPLYYEDFQIGTVFETPGRTITESDIINFAGVSGDFYSLHTDEIFASKTMYRGRIAHGLLVISIATGLWMRLGIFEGSLVALYGIDRLRFIKPVRIGDTIKVRMTVLEKVDRGEYGLITIRNEILNQAGDLVAIFDAKILIAKKPETQGN